MNVPTELKAIQPYLQRAQEVKTRDPFLAYQCQLYAAQLGYGLLESGGRSGECESFLLGLLDELETAKHELLEHPAMADDRLASSYILENSLKIFAAADAEDRNGNANKYLIITVNHYVRRTAKMFVAASNFMEVLKLYGPLPEDLEDKIKYAKWKAAEILKQEQTLPSLTGKFPPEQTKSMTDLKESLSIPDKLPDDYRPIESANNTQILTQAEKQARQAISAILFEDVPAAIDCLERALHSLKTIKQ